MSSPPRDPKRRYAWYQRRIERAHAVSDATREAAEAILNELERPALAELGRRLDAIDTTNNEG